jgi:hypothetical protein
MLYNDIIAFTTPRCEWQKKREINLTRRTKYLHMNSTRIKISTATSNVFQLPEEWPGSIERLKRDWFGLSIDHKSNKKKTPMLHSATFVQCLLILFAPWIWVYICDWTSTLFHMGCDICSTLLGSGSEWESTRRGPCRGAQQRQRHVARSWRPVAGFRRSPGSAGRCVQRLVFFIILL